MTVLLASALCWRLLCCVGVCVVLASAFCVVLASALCVSAPVNAGRGGKQPAATAMREAMAGEMWREALRILEGVAERSAYNAAALGPSRVFPSLSLLPSRVSFSFSSSLSLLSLSRLVHAGALKCSGSGPSSTARMRRAGGARMA